MDSFQTEEQQPQQLQKPQQLQTSTLIVPSAPPIEDVFRQNALHLQSIEELNNNLIMLKNIILQVESLLDIANLTLEARTRYFNHLQYCVAEFNAIQTELNSSRCI